MRDVEAVLPVLTLLAVVVVWWWWECYRPVPALHRSIILLRVTVRRGKIWVCGCDVVIDCKLYLVCCRQESAWLLCIAARADTAMCRLLPQQA